MAKQDDAPGWAHCQLAGNTDALSDWAFFTDPLRPAEGDGQLMPVTIGLRSGEIETLPERLSAWLAEVNRGRNGTPIGNPALVVPGAYRKRRKGAAGRSGAEPGDDYYTVLANGELFRLLAQPADTADRLHPANDVFFLVHGAAFPADALGAETLRDPVTLADAPPREGVVVSAVIDTGLPLLHERLRDAAGETRVHYAWVQDGAFKPSGPSFVPYGREFEARDLNDLIEAHSANGPLLNEVAAYRDAGLADFSARYRHILGHRRTHGAHVASLAAGHAPAENRTDNPVIAVQLPQWVTADTSGASIGPHLLAALDYIADRADRIAHKLKCGQLPLVINFSYGGLGGPLDGTHYLEQRMDALLATRNAGAETTALVLPSGNAHLSQCHARAVAGRDFKGRHKRCDLSWRVQPDDFTASFVEIWTPPGPPDERLAVRVAPPNMTAGPELGEQDGYAIEWKPNGDVVAKLAYEYVGPPTNRGRFLLSVQATARHGATVDLAPFGTWTISLRDTGLEPDAEVNAWVLRDDELPGYDTDARQARFIDPAYRRFDDQGRPEEADSGPSPVHRQGLQNVMGTGRRTITIGGYVRKSGRPARYSAGGATSTSDRPGPDAMTVSDESAVHFGVLGAGVLSGTRLALDGTSVAAPQIAREIATVLATGAEVNRATIGQWAADDEAAAFADRAPRPPASRSEHGRVERPPVVPSRRF